MKELDAMRAMLKVLLLLLLPLMIVTSLTELKLAQAEEEHFKKLHTVDVGEYKITEILDKDTMQRYLAFERKGEIAIIHKEPAWFRPADQCIDGSTGKLCTNPLIKDPYSIKSYFIPLEIAPKAQEQKSEAPQPQK